MMLIKVAPIVKTESCGVLIWLGNSFFPCEIGPRRAGDIAQCWADPGLAWKLLDWRVNRGLEQMCADAWRRQQKRERHVTGQ